MPKISIIVPIYKAEKYLKECIESILNQTYNDWELLLIDDGSPDKSGLICDEYATKDKRIRSLHKSNGGVSSARNFGLKEIRGEWVTFVDSDDCLYPKALQILLEYVEKENLDLVQCSFNTTYIESQISDIEIKKSTAKEYVKTHNVLTTVWGSLFKSHIILENNIIFDQLINLGEDQIFLFNYLLYVKFVSRIKEILYFYRTNPISAVHNQKPKHQKDSVRAFKALKRCNPLAQSQCDSMLFYWFISLAVNGMVPVGEITELFNDVHFSFCNPRCSKTEKIIYRMFKINILFTTSCIRLVYRIKKRCLK